MKVAFLHCQRSKGFLAVAIGLIAVFAIPAALLIGVISVIWSAADRMLRWLDQLKIMPALAFRQCGLISIFRLPGGGETEA